MTRTSEIWPNFFIVGAPRAGTTSLYMYLKQIPGIYMSPVKEPHYFSQDPDAGRRDEYLELFRAADTAIAVGEASVGYLRRPEVPLRIRTAVPHAKIIMSLRDPVEKVYSQYFEQVRKYAYDHTFAEMIRIEDQLASSLYAESVSRYLDIFGADRTKIIVFEEFAAEPRKTVSEIARFLGVDGEPPHIDLTMQNTYTSPRAEFTSGILRDNRMRRLWRKIAPAALRKNVRNVLYKPASKPQMPDDCRRYLEARFRGDVEKLESLLQRPLPWFQRESDRH